MSLRTNPEEGCRGTFWARRNECSPGACAVAKAALEAGLADVRYPVLALSCERLQKCRDFREANATMSNK